MNGTHAPVTADAARGNRAADRWRLAGCRIYAAIVLALALYTGGAAQTSPHGAISIDCEDCHTARSWGELARPMKFDHAATAFPLNGQHALAKCRVCHESLTFKGTENRCAGCHDDLHRGELGANCDRCHTPQSWLVPDMAQRHTLTAFPLVGKHLTADCRACHPNQQKHQYVGIRADCYGCHAPDYEGSRAPNHREAGFGTDCSQCHAVNAARWGGGFDHARTGFPLVGAHAATPCSRCHAGNSFANAGAQCISCHQQDYAGAASPSHTGFPTDCATCHSTIAWRPSSFDHTRTNFRLTGAHLAVACSHCHKNQVYAGTPTTCGSAACHLTQYNATASPSHVVAAFPLECQVCHTTVAWRPSSWSHDQYFPISAGSKHSPGRWNACTDCHLVPTSYTSFSCINCHEHAAQSTVDEHHKEVAGYSYNSAACYHCHPRGTSGGARR